MDNVVVSILISLLPIAAVTLMFLLSKNGRTVKKDLMFLLGFLSITAFFIFNPDPVLTSAYIDRGDYQLPLYTAAISTVFLFAAVFLFRKYRNP